MNKPILWICDKCGWFGKAEELDDPYNCPKCSKRARIMIQYKSNESELNNNIT